MNEKNINQTVKTSFEKVTPDVFDQVVEHCTPRAAKTVVLPARKNPYLRMISVAAAFLLLLGIAFTSIGYGWSNAVTTTVSLDVNPSVEILLNRNEKVKEIHALNEDARIILGDMNFEGSSLDVAINALIGSMLRNGYITELANSILISVDDNNADRAKNLQEKLTREIETLLQTETFNGAILCQTVTKTDELSAVAKAHNISLGKAKLINQLVAQNTTYTFEDLVGLSINDLNLLVESGHAAPENTQSSGTASEKAYIGFDKAKEIAFTHAAVPAGTTLNAKTDLDSEKGIIIYEVEFTYDGYEYEYDINATTGEILHVEKERDDDKRPSDNQSGTQTTPNQGTSSDSQSGTSNPPAATELTAEQVKQIAFNHAGVTADKVYGLKVERDRDDGVVTYDVEFKADGVEYEYEIHAVSGKILEYDSERDDDAARTSSTQTGSAKTEPAVTESKTTETKTTEASATITADRAKEIALAHAGVSAANARGLECEKDTDDRVDHYDVEFRANGLEYDYEISFDGTVLKSEKERDD